MPATPFPHDAPNRRDGDAIGAGDVLLLVDLQNDFCAGGALAIPDADAVIPLANALALAFRARGVPVIMTQDWHPARHSCFASVHPGTQPFETIAMPYGPQTLWPDHCIQGTRGADFHPGLEHGLADLVARKGSWPEIDSYSAFFENDRVTATGLGAALSDSGIRRLFVAGLATDFCVFYSAMDARRLGFEVILLEDACRGIDLDGSLARARAEWTHAGVHTASAQALLDTLA